MMVLDRKIAFIDLTNGSVRTEDPYRSSSEVRWRQGPQHDLLSQHYARELDPFSSENPLIFGAGFLSGTLGFGSRLNISSKSPESGHIGDTNMGESLRLSWSRQGSAILSSQEKANIPSTFTCIMEG